MMKLIELKLWLTETSSSHAINRLAPISNSTAILFLFSSSCDLLITSNLYLFIISKELVKSAKLEESMKELDIEKRRTDSLLYQMIPRSVADRLRQGEPALNTCEVFEFFSISRLWYN